MISWDQELATLWAGKLLLRGITSGIMLTPVFFGIARQSTDAEAELAAQTALDRDSAALKAAKAGGSSGMIKREVIINNLD
jgi:hypothetical protein